MVAAFGKDVLLPVSTFILNDDVLPLEAIKVAGIGRVKGLMVARATSSSSY